MEYSADSAATPTSGRVGSGTPVGSSPASAPVRSALLHRLALRRCVLSAAVLDDVDIFPQRAHAEGLVLGGVPAAHSRRHPPVQLTWAHIDEATHGHDPDSPGARQRLTRWLHLVWWLAELPQEMLRDAARLVGLPQGHVLHPGRGWALGRVLGGTIELGFGVTGLDPARAGEVVIVAPSAVRAAGLDTQGWLPPAAERLSRLSDLAAQRRQQDPRSPLMPYGEADVLTLLAGRALRAQLAGCEGDGLALVAVPMRTRAWTRLSLIDPAYIPLAYAATEPEMRGLPAALLVTEDEVVLARAGQPAEIALRDAGPPEPLQIVLRG